MSIDYYVGTCNDLNVCFSSRPENRYIIQHHSITSIIAENDFINSLILIRANERNDNNIMIMRGLEATGQHKPLFYT